MRLGLIHYKSNQIEFLLKAEGVNIDVNNDNSINIRYYYPSKLYKAKLFVQDGHFIHEKGSLITRPNESSKEWKDNFSRRYNNII